MEYYNGKLCVTYDDLAGIATMNAIQCIVKKDASIQARKACRSNPALFDLDRLPLKFQLEVYRRRPASGKQTVCRERRTGRRSVRFLPASPVRRREVFVDGQTD